MVCKARRNFSFLGVKKDQINIGAVIELSTAKFSNCQDGEFSRGRAERLAKLRIPMSKHFANTDLGDVRQLRRCFLKICRVRQTGARSSAIRETTKT